jgi:hypothetical protein
MNTENAMNTENSMNTKLINKIDTLTNMVNDLISKNKQQQKYINSHARKIGRIHQTIYQICGKVFDHESEMDYIYNYTNYMKYNNHSSYNFVYQDESDAEKEQECESEEEQEYESEEEQEYESEEEQEQEQEYESEEETYIDDDIECYGEQLRRLRASTQKYETETSEKYEDRIKFMAEQEDLGHGLYQRHRAW